MNLSALLLSAFFTGLAGSAHCLGMCGSIGTALGASAQKPVQALAYHGGRLLSYSAIGLLCGAVLPLLGIHPAMGAWGIWLRRATALLIAFIGLQQLLGINLFRCLERAGKILWRPIGRLLPNFLPARTASDAFILGILWGMLPCGLIYGALAVAISTANPFAAAAVMLAFGFGTLPAMLSLTLFSQQAAGWLSGRWPRLCLGGALLVLAAVSWH